MKTYQYSISTNVLWASFDFGTVEAHNPQEAREKALAALKNDFLKVNNLLVSIGATIDFNTHAIEIIEL
jgi:hypothetical protein